MIRPRKAERVPPAAADLLDEMALDLASLCRLAGVSESWFQARAGEGLLPPALDVGVLRRTRRMAWLERHFDAVPELAALVLDLEDELARMRARLERLQR